MAVFTGVNLGDRDQALIQLSNGLTNVRGSVGRREDNARSNILIRMSCRIRELAPNKLKRIANNLNLRLDDFGDQYRVLQPIC